MQLSSEVSHRAFQLLDAFQDHKPQQCLARSTTREGTAWLLSSKPHSGPQRCFALPILRRHWVFWGRGFPKMLAEGSPAGKRSHGATWHSPLARQAGHAARIPGDNQSMSHSSGQIIKVTSGGLMGLLGSHGSALPQGCRGAGVPCSSQQRGLPPAPDCCKLLG